MKEGKELSPETSGVMYVVSKAFMDSMIEKQDRILAMLEEMTGYKSDGMVGDYVSEEHAKTMLGRKSTWFWMMRNKGLISFTKVGRKTFYKKQELLSLLEDNSKSAYRKR
ncbi:MAG TPA: hypothetical protein VNW06_10720 [Cytophagaceae bacterium]|jgi:hypothetical protein|nr:hypothetical protein [Cytophagaceae bacterium]